MTTSEDDEPSRLSQASIHAAAEELARDPDGYFRRRREQRSREAHETVQRDLNKILSERQRSRSLAARLRQLVRRRKT